ncbi:MAG: glycosyltransferase [Oscillospiraceae bacterium]|jgi:glycosyltransferase involved in cell wall biosynthesis|nr:glycosyltransferase [Oscillospiraceae bacterium]
MRIAQFSDSFLPIVDGVGRVVFNYANTIAEKGHESYVVAPLADIGYRGGCKFDLIDYQGMRLKNRQYKLGIPLIDMHFLARINKTRLDVIHAHSPVTAGQFAAGFSQKRGIPLVGTFHSKYREDILEATGMSMIAAVGTKLVVDFYEKCDEVWTVSASAAETLRSYGFRGKIIVMPNGADMPAVNPDDRERAARAFALGNETVFLFVGQQDWKKNIEKILLAAAILKRRGFAFKLVFAGQGPHAEEIKKRAGQLGLDGRMVYTGHISDSAMLAGLYQCADLFVFPSLYDTAGLVVLEAAAFGTPSVVVRGSSAAEPIRDGENGFLCENDELDLAHILEKAVADKETLRAVGGRAALTLPRTWDDVVDRALARYSALLEIKKKSARD